jgi:hypothetical protein
VKTSVLMVASVNYDLGLRCTGHHCLLYVLMFVEDVSER